MEFIDYYKVLGVEPDADLKAIKTAYRKLARKYHPDLSKESDAEARFKEVAEAYEVLKDTQKRAEYDEMRRYGGASPGGGFTPPPGWESSAQGSSHFEGDFSDFFESLFGGADPRRDPRQHRGRDIEVELPVFLEDTLSEAGKKISYRVPQYSADGRRMEEVTKNLNVKIPRGVADNERIRLKGQGVPGQAGAGNGDLYLHIRLVPHPLFDVEGHNLIVTVPVAPWEAVLGAKITVPTLTGKIQLTVPANTQAGQRLRIKGNGLHSKTGRGDLYAVFKVVVPDRSGEDERQLWQQLAETSDFNPRDAWIEK